MIQRLIALAKFFYAQRITGFVPPDEPHFDPLSTPEFTRRLQMARAYLEFGAGGSTLLASRLGIPTTTVENDRFFARSVKNKLGGDARNKMIVVHVGLTVEWGIPMFKRPTKRRLQRWVQYPRAPFKTTDRENFPDLILIDGRFRVACALESVRQANRLGVATTICIDDYVDPVHSRSYREIEHVLGTPKLVGRMAIFEIDGKDFSISEDQVLQATAAMW